MGSALYIMVTIYNGKFLLSDRSEPFLHEIEKATESRLVELLPKAQAPSVVKSRI